MFLTEMASFINYLIRTEGMDKISDLFNMRQPEIIDGQRVVFPPDYFGIYGFEFNQLEYQWLRSLMQSGVSVR
jgi:hypothetical protein